MPRKTLIRTADYPYHVTMRVNHKEWFSIDLNDVWEHVKSSFKYAKKKRHVKIHAFVLMNNHYHMLISTPDANIDEFMYFFNKKLSEYIRRQSGKINRMFGGNYHWSLITSNRYLHNVIRYIYQNPIRAQITDRVQNYPYSSLNRKVTKIEHLLDTKAYLSWLNTAVRLREDDYIRRGLKKGKFKLSKDPNTRREFQLSMEPCQ